MSHPPDGHGHVVVAIDGSDEGYAAASYAASEATLLDASLDVVHVLPAYLPVGPLHPIGPLIAASREEFQARADEVLAKALEVVRETSGTLPVHTTVLTGGRVHQITKYAERARLLVLGRRDSRLVDQVWTGGTIAGVASQVPCEVIVAPAGRAPEQLPKRVVAGFKSQHHAPELFAAAFSAAQNYAVDLVVVHAWKLHSVYDEVIADRATEETVSRQQKDVIWRMLADFRSSYPSVRVRIEVTHDVPVRALVRAAQGAHRLVIVRPAHGALVHHLGRTARGVLREAACPIHVVPSARRAELIGPPLTLEQSGDLVR